MSPVSPVFHTVVTVSIGLKSAFRMMTSIHPCLKGRASKIPLFLELDGNKNVWVQQIKIKGVAKCDNRPPITPSVTCMIL